MREASFRDATLSSRMTSLIRAGACGCDCCRRWRSKGKPRGAGLKILPNQHRYRRWLVDCRKALGEAGPSSSWADCSSVLSLSSLGLLQSCHRGCRRCWSFGAAVVLLRWPALARTLKELLRALDAGDCTAMSSLREDYRRCCGIRFMLASVERGIHD